MSIESKEILYLASKNQHKLEELRAILGSSFDVRLCSELDPHIAWEETGSTFSENALIKARVVRSRTSCAVLADDSGLEVEALDGAPGIYSSRFGGVDGDDKRNNQKLLEELEKVDAAAPLSARFVCCLAYVSQEGQERIFEGYCHGEITKEARGQEGFGYDPHFVVQGTDRTLAEHGSEEKNAISHRKKALEKFSAEVLR